MVTLPAVQSTTGYVEGMDTGWSEGELEEIFLEVVVDSRGLPIQILLLLKP